VSLQDVDEKIAHNKEQIGEQLNFDFIEPPRASHRDGGVSSYLIFIIIWLILEI
jgi:hypothetical protein